MNSLHAAHQNGEPHEDTVAHLEGVWIDGTEFQWSAEKVVA
jgi:hypothetical protein